MSLRFDNDSHGLALQFSQLTESRFMSVGGSATLALALIVAGAGVGAVSCYTFWKSVPASSALSPSERRNQR